MSQAEEDVQLPGTGKALARVERRGDDLEWADLRSAVGWIRSRRVLLGAILLIVAQLAWKAQFLSTLYFRQDDFHDLDLAVDHGFTWKYLTFIGSGHLIIGLRIIAWVLVRVSSTPYNWLLASTVSLVFVAAASIAAYRLLRDLFGERPAILIPLAIYLLSPLTMPDLGIWSSAMESVPLQLATFLALSAHLRYVRTRRWPYLAASAFWMVFGLIFFEKGLVLPLLLFGVTAAYLVDRRSLLGGIFNALRKYWLAWLLYIVLAIGYLAVLAEALHTSTSQPKVPISASGVLTFVWELLRDTFIPGSIGGPWQWFPVAGNSFSFAAPPPALVGISIAVLLAIVVVSIWLRPVAWRAWLILAVWLAAADMLPVAIGRINTFNPSVLGLETRYVADAMPVLAICVGLAFLPVMAQPSDRASAAAEAQAAGRSRHHRSESSSSSLRPLAAGLVGVFVFSSIWSVSAYEGVTNGNEARDYITNAALALKDAPRGTKVVDRPMPQNIVEGTFEAYAYTSKVVGYMEKGKLKGKLDWISRPTGTIDGLMTFGTDGRLHVIQVYGTTSQPRADHSCWPQRHGRIVVPFIQASSGFSGTVRIGYIWSGSTPAVVYVRYGHTVQRLAVEPGLHAGFLHVLGSARGIVVSGLGGIKMCVGDVEAGNIGPANAGTVIPPLPSPAHS